MCRTRSSLDAYSLSRAVITYTGWHQLNSESFQVNVGTCSPLLLKVAEGYTGCVSTPGRRHVYFCPISSPAPSLASLARQGAVRWSAGDLHGANMWHLHRHALSDLPSRANVSGSQTHFSFFIIIASSSSLSPAYCWSPSRLQACFAHWDNLMLEQKPGSISTCDSGYPRTGGRDAGKESSRNSLKERTGSRLGHILRIGIEKRHFSPIREGKT